MPGDPASGKDDELVSQIDELKARMDRLMQGGSSTSNSALLTDDQRTRKPEPSKAVEPAPSVPPVPPGRSRVGDLIKSEDSEIVEVYPGPESVVPFPSDQVPDRPVASKPTPVAPAPPAPPKSKPSVDGSLISVDGSGGPQPRPQASTFDELDDVIQQELANDSSVPPKKGPDLASRFGSAEVTVTAEAAPKPAPKQVVEEPVAEEVLVEEELEHEEEVYDDPEPSQRSPVGLVAAIWVVATLASGAIATLHFTGAI